MASELDDAAMTADLLLEKLATPGPSTPSPERSSDGMAQAASIHAPQSRPKSRPSGPWVARRGSPQITDCPSG